MDIVTFFWEGGHHLILYVFPSGFLEKNRDALNSDILKLIGASTNKLLPQLFEKELSANVVKNLASNNRIVLTPKSSLRVCGCCYY